MPGFSWAADCGAPTAATIAITVTTSISIVRCTGRSCFTVVAPSSPNLFVNMNFSRYSPYGGEAFGMTCNTMNPLPLHRFTLGIGNVTVNMRVDPSVLERTPVSQK